MSIINRKLYQKGFSLIELMVAVAILAMAIFGIFLAFSTSFQGMADARAVTVATNYAREAMEDIKNMDFDEIPTPEIESSSVTVNGITYNRQVIVQESSNIKKVITTVTWKDRNGKQKMVETDMVVHFIETTAGVATKTILYADPYNVLVLENEYDTPTTKNKSIITAVIKDAIGNTIIDWDKEVIFSLTGSAGSGSLSSTTIPPGNPITISPDDFINGKAIITFTSSDDTGEAIITASTEGLTPDSVTINVYDPGVPVKINLTNFFPSEPEKEILFMKPGSTSTIKATIVDATGDTVLISEKEFTMTFTVSVRGTLDNQLFFGPGVVTTVLTSSLTAGTITVTASASTTEFGVISGVINVITGGKIILSASPIEVPSGEESVITITIKDVDDVPINYDGDIDLAIVGNGSGLGTLLPNHVDFGGSTSSEEVIFTAISEGTVEIEATDPNEILDLDSITLTVIEELTPHHLIVYAMPLSIPVGGAETLITAKVMTEGNVKVTSYNNEPVTFETTAGSFSSSTGTTIYTTVFNDGIATAVLYSSLSDIGTATITVSSTVSAEPEYIITGSTEVGFYIGPDHIELTADPQNILVSGQNCTVTAKIVDYTGTMISSYNGDIYFSISPCPATIKYLEATTSFLTQKIKKGITTVKLISGDSPGTAVIYAFSENLFGSLNIPVGIRLELVVGSVYYNCDSETNICSVSFNIDVQGADLLLEQIYFWTENQDDTLQTIEMDDDVVYDGEVASPATVTFIPVILHEGEHTVELYFIEDTTFDSDEEINVIFNPNSGNFEVEFLIP